MTDSGDIKRTAVLANGVVVPLREACRRLNILGAYLQDEDIEWQMVYLLRQVCLGNKIDPEQTRALVREGLLEPDGTVEPILSAIVLSAVRGEGRVLRLDSPFTDSLDRAMAEFITSREFVRCHMGEVDASAFIAHDPVQDSFEKYRKATDPGSILKRRGDGSDSQPPSPPGGSPFR